MKRVSWFTKHAQQSLNLLYLTRMLTGEQIDYLLQIKDTKPSIPDKTVRVMLGALFWSPQEIDHAIDFLHMPPAPDDALPPVPVNVGDRVPAVPKEKPITIKQNPFPIGSPLLNNVKPETGDKKRRLRFAGAIFGFVIFVGVVISYATFSTSGQ